MSTKKYLSLEEAATILKIKPDELIRLREKGDVRGFADRGTWKFKAEDIEELTRRRQPDSNPDVPMIDEDDEVGRQPTVITKGRGAASDSDVRLVPDDKMRSKLTGSSAEIPVMGDSDSDVRLSGAATREMSSDSDVRLVLPKDDSDSDVQLADSDSDVRISDSDSDVRLAPPKPSDSDVQLVDRGKKLKSSDSDVSLLPKGAKASRRETIDFDDASLTGSESVLLEDSGMPLGPDSGIRLGGGSSLRLSGDSGINLSTPADSGILLEGPGESGFPLRGDGNTLSETSDSDISIEEDSGITLEADSGIRLSGDSGIRLDAGDSGIRLSDAPQSGAKRGKPKDDLDSSIPLLLSDKDGGRTDVEVPMIDDDGSELETLNLPKSPKKKKSKGDTSVIVFDEDGDSGKGLDESSGNLGDDDYESDSISFEDDELEVAEDILGSDEDLEQLEVFDSDDSVFDESFVEGGSSVAIPAMSGRIQMAPEVEWGTGTMVLLFGSTLALSLGALVSVDLLRTIWGGGGAAVYPGELIGMFGGFFK